MNFKSALLVAVFLFAMAVYATPVDFVDELGVVDEQGKIVKGICMRVCVLRLRMKGVSVHFCMH